MAETELTKKIKLACHTFKPQLNTQMRTIRYADEILCPNGGYVDSIRFEDYVATDESYCLLEHPERGTAGDRVMIDAHTKYNKLKCAAEYPNQLCVNCVWKHTRHILDMLITCYEIKVSVSDFKSNNGHNFFGNHNYYVVASGIYDSVKSLVPDEVGIIVYYEKSGQMRVKKECEFREVDSETKVFLLYNALKKWCDGKQTGRELSVDDIKSLAKILL